MLIYSRDSFLSRHRGPEGLRQERGGVEIREAVSGTGRDGRELQEVRISKKNYIVGGRMRNRDRLLKLSDIRETRGSQDPKGMDLVEMHREGEDRTCREHQQ